MSTPQPRLRFRQFVKIVNRDHAYTNAKKAYSYCYRGLAAPVCADDSLMISEIRMLESAEITMHRSRARAERDPVTGNFAWAVGDCRGSQIMKAYEDISGGYRVLKARRGETL